jgi:hypothetical protein
MRRTLLILAGVALVLLAAGGVVTAQDIGISAVSEDADRVDEIGFVPEELHLVQFDKSNTDQQSINLAQAEPTPFSISTVNGEDADQVNEVPFYRGEPLSWNSTGSICKTIASMRILTTNTLVS